MEITERKLQRKAFKADIGKLGLGLLIVLMMYDIGCLVVEKIAKLTFMKDATDAAVESFLSNSEIGMIIGAILGAIFLFFLYLPRKTHQQIFVKNKKMTFSWFVVFVGIGILFDGICVPVDTGLEMFLNLLGYSAQSSMESASADSTTISGFIYTAIVAPIFEEIVYRGFAMRIFGKYGKTFAIVASAILFGVMHGNISQGIAAALSGIIWGYVAMEYSIIWSIALHVFNNMVICELTGLLPDGPIVVGVIGWLIIALSVTGVIAIIKKCKQILSYIRENKWDKPYMRWTFTTITILLFVIGNIGYGIYLFDKI